MARGQIWTVVDFLCRAVRGVSLLPSAAQLSESAKGRFQQLKMKNDFAPEVSINATRFVLVPISAHAKDHVVRAAAACTLLHGARRLWQPVSFIWRTCC
jgi:hypothetical protein